MHRVLCADPTLSQGSLYEASTEERMLRHRPIALCRSGGLSERKIPVNAAAEALLVSLVSFPDPQYGTCMYHTEGLGTR